VYFNRRSDFFELLNLTEYFMYSAACWQMHMFQVVEIHTNKFCWNQYDR
jgi:hypothetical protein